MSNDTMQKEYFNVDQRHAVCQSQWGERMDKQKSIRLHAKFTRLEAAERMVYGYASTEAVDTFDTAFEASWWPHALEGYRQSYSLSAMHERPNVGSVTILEVRPKGLWIGARVDDLDEWALVEDGTYEGFSIEFFATKSRLDIVDGKEVVVFTEFVLTDITIGDVPSNKDATFQVIGRLQKEKDAPWDFDWSKDAQDIVDLFGFEGLKEATLYQVPGARLDEIETYRLPIAKVSRGKLTIYRMALHASMAVINGARAGEEDYTKKEKEDLYTKITEAFLSFNETAPQLRLTGGIKMSNFGEYVSDLLKKITGKDVTEEHQKEIGELEKRLADEKDNGTESAKLVETIEKLETRLKELETAGEKKASDTSEAETAKKVTEFLDKVDKRLDVLEKSASQTKQITDKEVRATRTADQKSEDTSGGMNSFIRASSGVAIPGGGSKEEE
ncbi:unnamed protein product [marine sediment metagenome]|uniref:Phage-like element PBSX protein XkdF domain-containing protein n=1 Tax=marine sediment metagenome TaxID=412755 RepID=X0TBJ0_9ZZZZ